MCGVFGSPNITPEVRRMLPYLAWEMQNRGTHSWGASDGNQIIKHLGPICHTWYDERDVIAGWDAGIFHTRAASHGAHDKVENAHPFVGVKPDGTQVIGIHNGQLRNHDDLNRLYGRECEVDSMHLWLNRAAGLSWKPFNGFANLVWWETREDGEQVQLMTRLNSQNLHIIRTRDGGLVWASSIESLIKAAAFAGTAPDKIYGTVMGKVYRGGTDGILYETDETVEFTNIGVTGGDAMPRTVPFVSGGPTTGGGGVTRSGVVTSYPRTTRDDTCYKCAVPLGPDKILCGSCIWRMLEDFREIYEPEDPALAADPPLIITATQGGVA